MSNVQNPFEKYAPAPEQEQPLYQRKRRTERSPLSPREAHFVAKLCEGVEPIDAMRQSHYRVVNHAAAKLLLEQPHIQAAIATHQEAQSQTASVTLQRLIAEHAGIAFSDIADILGSVTSIADVAALPPEVSAAIKSVKETRNGLEITLHDKHRSLDALAKIADLYRSNETEEALSSFGELLRAAARARGVE